MVQRNTVIQFTLVVELIKCGSYKILFDNFNSNSLSSINSIKTYDFSTLYTNIPHTKLKSRLAELIRNTFRFKNEKKRYEYIVVGYKSTYFVRNHSEAKNKYTEDDIVDRVPRR